MSKFEIKLSDDELWKVITYIDIYTFPRMINKGILTLLVFGDCTSWNIRKVREAVSRLQEKGYPIIAHHGGYSVFGDDPQPVIEYLNREYHRVYEATKKNDQIFHAFKQKYGDAVSEKIQQMPGQPMLDQTIYPDPVQQVVNGMDAMQNWINGGAYRKSIDARGNEIALQFEADA